MAAAPPPVKRSLSSTAERTGFMQKSSLVAAPARAAATRSDGVFAEERRPNAPIRSSSTPKLAIAVPGASTGSVNRINSGGQGVLVPLGPSRFTVGDAVSAEIPVAALTAVATPGRSTPRVAAPGTSQIVSLDRPPSGIVAAPGSARSQIVSLDRPRSEIVFASLAKTAAEDQLIASEEFAAGVAANYKAWSRVPMVAAPGTLQIVSLDRPPASPRSDIVATSGRSTPRVA